MTSIKKVQRKSGGQSPERVSPALKRVAEGVGEFMEYWGFKAIHGRIWTLLFLSSEPMSAVQLARVLRVSKTLLSFSISELLKYEVIQEVGRGLKRTVYFRANPNLGEVIFNVLKARERPMMTEIQSAVEGLRAQLRKKGSEQQPNLLSGSKKEVKVDEEQLESLIALVGSASCVLDAVGWDSLSQDELTAQFRLVSAALGVMSFAPETGANHG